MVKMGKIDVCHHPHTHCTSLTHSYDFLRPWYHAVALVSKTDINPAVEQLFPSVHKRQLLRIREESSEEERDRGGEGVGRIDGIRRRGGGQGGFLGGGRGERGRGGRRLALRGREG